MQVKNIRTLAFTLALPLALSQGACSDDADFPLVPDANSTDASQLGVVEFRLHASGASVSEIQVAVTNAAGTSVHTSTVGIDPVEQGASMVLALPGALGYTMTLSATGEGGMQCSGNATFNVVVGQIVEVPVTLTCVSADTSQNNNGNVKVEINVEVEERECPDVSMMSAFPDKTNVKGKMQLSSSASKEGVSFRWSASSGHFSAASSANTTYTCGENGPVTLTLAVETAADCRDEHSMEVICSVDEDASRSCDAIVAACHDKDPKDGGAVSQCHHIGHSGDVGKCSAEQSRCVDLCNNAATPAKRVEINFEGRVGDEAFDCSRTYTGLGSTGDAEASPNDFRFYVYDLVLVKADGSEAPVTIEDRGDWQRFGTALIDVEDGPGAGCFGGSAGTNNKITGTVAQGEYVGMKFRNGVPPAYNHGDPSTLQAPLNASGMIWSWLSGFKFVKLELATHLVHVGSTSCSGAPPDDVTCAKENRNQIVLDNFNPDDDVVIADIAAVFANSDLNTEQSCHSSGDACGALFEALGVNFETGAATDSQSFFRVK